MRIIFLVLLFCITLHSQSNGLFFHLLMDGNDGATYNRLVYTAGNAPTEEGLNTALGFEVTNYRIYADSIVEFDDINYTVPNGAFLGVGALSFYLSASTIVQSGFKETNIEELSFPLCHTVGRQAFQLAYGLVSISLPSVTTIGISAFANCPLLDSISFPLAVHLDDNAFELSSIVYVSLASADTIHSQLFASCTSLRTVLLPSAIVVRTNAFQDCSSSLGTIEIPICEKLGSSVSDDGVFTNVMGATITLTVPEALMTCNEGNPDGDIQYLQANNTVTIINP